MSDDTDSSNIGELLVCKDKRIDQPEKIIRWAIAEITSILNCDSSGEPGIPDADPFINLYVELRKRAGL